MFFLIRTSEQGGAGSGAPASGPTGGPLLIPAPSGALSAAAAIGQAGSQPTGGPAAAQPAPSPTPSPQGGSAAGPMTTADLERLLSERDARHEAALADLRGSLKGTLLEVLNSLPGAGAAGAASPANPARGRAAPGTPAAGAPAPGQTTAPEVAAVRTELEKLQLQQAKTEQQLAEANTRVARKEAEAAKAALQQAVYGTLTGPENRLSAEQASVATQFLMQQGAVVVGQDDPNSYFLQLKGASGQTETLNLDEGLRQWLNSATGMVFRPAVPAGSGGSGGQITSAGAPPRTPQDFIAGPPSPEKFSEAFRRQSAANAQRPSQGRRYSSN